VKRPLRLLMLMVGLVPAIVLGLVAAYGMVGSNTWSVTSTVVLDVQAEDVTVLTDDVRKWRDWMLIDHVAEEDFMTVQSRQVTGAGATLGWMTGFLAGEVVLSSEWEDGESYSLDWLERRAGRPSPTSTNSNPDPTGWVESTGTLEVRLADDNGITLTLIESGSGGPRPLGPFLLNTLETKRHDVLDQRLSALAELALVAARRRETIEAVQ
jgi:hypothetical protein